MTALHLLALLLYTFGAYAHGAILLLSMTGAGRRGWAGQPLPPHDKPTEAEWAGVALMALGFVWFVTNLVLVVLSLGPAFVDWPLQLCSIWLAFCYPPLIIHVTVAELPAHAGIWRRLVGPAYLVSLAFPFWATLSLAGVVGVSDRTLGMILGFALPAAFITASAVSVALSARAPRASATPRQRVGDRVMNLMFAVMIVLFLLLPALAFAANPSLGAVAGRSVEIAAKSLPLAFLFVGAYFESRFDFFDILIKRGLALFTTLAALAGFFALALPWLQRFKADAAPWVYTLTLLPVALALPWLHARIADALDRRWLGRRYTNVNAVTRFIAALRPATTEAQLVERAQASLGEIFGAPAIVRLEPAADAAPPFDVVENVTIQTLAGVRGTVLMGRRASEAPYFSEDCALLASLADVLASIVDNLHLQARRQELSLHASRSELKALRAQINPHFLFNALNAIAGLIHRDPARADRTLEQLSDVFRYALRGADREWALLDEELDFVGAYLNVERARFGDRLRVDIRSDATARAARVPMMIVQTLVENAVKHGVADVRGVGSVEVDARVDHDRLIVAVTDNGPGFPPTDPALPEPVDGERGSPGYGLANVRQRLYGYFGDEAALTIDRDEARGLTTVSVALPVALTLHQVQDERVAEAAR